MTGPGRRAASVEVGPLLDRGRAGERAAVARLISLVESDSPARPAVAAALVGTGGRARVVGLTGAPGVGKSTSTSALIHALRAEGRRVGVLAVDPSSPFSGGALLGDRVRMQDHATDDGVFIRSMASRGQLGGLSAAVPQAVRVLDAAGFDVILVETVGVGQAEVDIAAHADTAVVVLAPGFGDGIQAAKAGVLEIADVFVVNKADRDGADRLARELRHAQALSATARGARATAWTAPILKTVAARGEGAPELVAALDAHHGWLVEHDELAGRRQVRAASEIEAIALGRVRARFTGAHGAAELRPGPASGARAAQPLAAVAARVAAGTLDPYAAAEELLAGL